MTSLNLWKNSSLRGVAALLCACWLLVSSSLAGAQPPAREYFGLVEAFDEPGRLILIDDEEIPFERDRIRVFFRGNQVDGHFLIRGLRIRYNLDSDGYIRDVHLLSPIDVIEEMLVN